MVGCQDIKNAKNFSRTIAESKIGSEIILRTWQNAQTKDINITIAQMPEVKKQTRKMDIKFLKGYIPEFGLVVKNEGNKVIVEEILGYSDISAKGIKTDDVIVKINDSVDDKITEIKTIPGRLFG
jgi:S1-C subfamily serine protease